MRTRRGLVVLLAAAILLLPTFAPLPARASFPGTNGLIAFNDASTSGDIDIFVVSPDGSGRQNITNTPAVDELYPAFSPDGTRIAYVRREREPVCCDGDGNPYLLKDLWVMNADGSGATNVTNGSFSDIDSPAWSPDASRFAVAGTVAGEYGLWVVTAGGSRTRIIDNATWVGTPDWSPDGQHIAFAAYGDNWSSLMGVWVVTAAGLEPVLIAMGSGGIGAASPSWSPDGTAIVFDGPIADDGILRIHIATPDGTTDTILRDGGEPSWSPDVSRIAYTAAFPDAGIWVMNADGTNPAMVTASGSQPSWGRDTSLHYDFTGFFAPVDNNMLNVAKAGSAIPVKFSLGGDQGLDIFADGYPKVVPTPCPVEQADAVEDYVVASTSGLQYDPVADQYTYVWKTMKGVKGCYEFQMKLADGSTHSASFQYR